MEDRNGPLGRRRLAVKALEVHEDWHFEDSVTPGRIVREHLEMLARTNWSQTDAAERFKIPLSTLNQKIKRLQIDVKRRREE